jgi:predicted nucleotidyltransferase
MSTPLAGPHSTGTKGAPRFPTQLHRDAADAVSHFFSSAPKVDTVLVVNSCARGKATPDSDLDLAVLVEHHTSATDIQSLESTWHTHALKHPAVLQYRASGAHAHLHLDIFDGRFSPGVWDEGGGPDSFEIEIGNRIAYSVPMNSAGPYFQQLQSQWLPYYSDDLRHERLVMVHSACQYDLDHIPLLHHRGLHFHAFDRLYKAFQEFLQALFIARCTYPIAYNKWIREQVQDRLQLPELYRELPALLSISNIETAEIENKAAALKALLQRWIAPHL